MKESVGAVDANLLRRNHRRLNELFWEFDDFVRQLRGFYFDSLAGYSLINRKLSDEKNLLLKLAKGCTEEDIDKGLFSHGELDKTLTDVPAACGTMGDFIRRNCASGMNSTVLAAMCVVNAVGYWECYLRKEVAIALGVLAKGERDENRIREILSKHVADDFWGDLCTLRNALLHKNGVVSSKLEKAKVLRGFKSGDRIQLDQRKMRIIFIGFDLYRNKIHDESLPQSEPAFIWAQKSPALLRRGAAGERERERRKRKSGRPGGPNEALA